MLRKHTLMSKNYDVLVQKNGRIQWMSVPGCITHSEARSQGEEMYDGKILQRFNGVDDDDDDDDDSDNGSISDTFAWMILIAIGFGLFLVITMWPIFLIGGIIYGLYKILKK